MLPSPAPVPSPGRVTSRGDPGGVQLVELGAAAPGTGKGAPPELGAAESRCGCPCGTQGRTGRGLRPQGGSG